MGERASSLRTFRSARFHLPLRRTDNACLSVAGDHTRTVTIIAPTSGGLMSFAVKRVTCLGCKTPLKPNALSQSCDVNSQASLELTRRSRRPSCLQQLPAEDRRAARQAGRADFTGRDGFRSALDAVPAVSRLPSPGKVAHPGRMLAVELTRRTGTGCPVHVQGLPNLLHAQEGAERSGRLRRHPAAL